MTKHSKNNTASSIFSYAEYKKLDYGTKKVRVSQLGGRFLIIIATSRQRVHEALQFMFALPFQRARAFEL